MSSKEELIKILKRALEIAKDLVDEPGSSIQEKLLQPFQSKYDREQFDSDSQKILDLVFDESWPQAVPDFMICDGSENSKSERANGILEWTRDDLTGKKFLDFGCGEGHVALAALKNASKSVGYDIEKNWTTSEDNQTLTNKWEDVVSQGPYDVILLYDVLDHLDSPIDVLNQVMSVAKHKSKVYVRCHTWMSRHGAHLYKKLNKAWIQLVLEDHELEKLNLRPEIKQRVHYPLATQKNWFSSVGLSIISEETIRSKVPEIMKKDILKKRINLDGKFPEFQMEQDFNDFVLEVTVNTKNLVQKNKLALDLLEQDYWPQAVNPALIARNENELRERSEGIVEHLSEFDIDVSGKVCFVFCDKDKSLAQYLSSLCSHIFAYDKSFEQFHSESLSYINDLHDLEKKVDLVIAFDVIDDTEDSQEFIDSLRTVSSPDTCIFVRCHPWSSRHGSHLYKEKNKAFIHMVFTEDELESMGLKALPKGRVKNPQEEYLKMFIDAGFSVKEIHCERTSVESFFSECPDVKKRIMKNYPNQDQSKLAEYQLEQSFVDLVLRLEN